MCIRLLNFKEALKVRRSLGEGSSRSSTVLITSVQTPVQTSVQTEQPVQAQGHS